MEFSPLMLGTVQFGVDYGIANKAGKPSGHQVNEMISWAWENGVNCLDTASAYGDSETVVGNALQDLRLSHRMKVVSKIDHFADELSPQETKGHIYKSVHNSLRRLKIEYLDVCLFHHEKYFYAMEWLHELKDQGYVKATGLSFSGVDFDDAAKVLSSPLVDVVQVPGSLLDQRFEKSGFDFALQQSKPVFVRSVYLQGLLVQETAPPHLAMMQPVLDIIGKLSKEYKISRESLCVRYMLGVNGASSLLMGVDHLDQLKENIAIIKEGALPPETHQEIAQALPSLSAELLCPYLWPRV